MPYVSAVAPGGLRGQGLDLLSVQLGGAAVVLGVGGADGAPVLIEKGELPQEGQSEIWGRERERERGQAGGKSLATIRVRMLQGLTALALPPTCMHRSWNQDQLKSSSVDLRTHRDVRI